MNTEKTPSDMITTRAAVNLLIPSKLWTLMALLGAAAGPALAANKAEVSLVPAVSAVAPGEAFEIGLRFKIKKGWHIYWRNPGEAGMPPKVTWHLPEGFVADDLRFPVPKRYIDRAKIVTHIHEGEPVFLATITPPEDLGGLSSVRITGDLVWLVCAKQCLQEKQSVSVKLPVAQNADQVRPANQELFKNARQALPVPGPKGKHVMLKPYLGRGMLDPGSMFEIHLDVEIEEGFHIQSHKPDLPRLTATDVFVGPAEGVWIESPVFPEPEIREIPRLGKTGQFGGTITVRTPVEADEELAGDSREFGGVFVYQACEDKSGACLPPEGVEWSFTIPVGVAAGSDDDARSLAEAQPAPPEDLEAGDSRPTGDADAGLTDHPAAREPVGSAEETASAGTLEEQSFGQRLEVFLKGLGLPGLLLGCFIYGLVLNATPCVLPLLSIKVMGFVHQAHQSRRRAFALALAFGLGVVLFFIPLGLLAAHGTNVLQFPVAVITLSTVVFALALSMLGVYTLQVPTAATKLDATLQKEGVFTSFGKGALAPVLGFACTGPLLAGFFGLATKQDSSVAIAAFVTMGLGMASPYVLLGANPNWLRFLPKPGNWMITFERIMGFLLLAMVVWLISPLATQVGAGGILWTAAFLVAVGFACWILGQINFSMETAVRLQYRVGAVGVVFMAAVLIYGWAFPLGEAYETQRRLAGAGLTAASGDGLAWQKWSPESVVEAVSSGRTVFVDFTAAYCTVCKANKKLAIDTPEVQRKMKELGVLAFRGDFTFGDKRIGSMLKEYDRAGVPLNLVYPPNRPKDPIVLRPTLTKDYLLQKLGEAGRSRNLASIGSTVDLP